MVQYSTSSFASRALPRDKAPRPGRPPHAVDAAQHRRAQPCREASGPLKTHEKGKTRQAQEAGHPLACSSISVGSHDDRLQTAPFCLSFICHRSSAVKLSVSARPGLHSSSENAELNTWQSKVSWVLVQHPAQPGRARWTCMAHISLRLYSDVEPCILGEHVLLMQA